MLKTLCPITIKLACFCRPWLPQKTSIHSKNIQISDMNIKKSFSMEKESKARIYCTGYNWFSSGFHKLILTITLLSSRFKLWLDISTFDELPHLLHTMSTKIIHKYIERIQIKVAKDWEMRHTGWKTINQSIVHMTQRFFILLQPRFTLWFYLNCRVFGVFAPIMYIVLAQFTFTFYVYHKQWQIFDKKIKKSLI